MEKTAVEWLTVQLKRIELKWQGVGQGQKHRKEEELEVINQAKQMEHKQREKEFIEGYKIRAELSNLIFDKASELFARELFNKTYKPG